MRRRRNRVAILLIGAFMSILLVYILSTFVMSAERKVKRVVHEFYEYESAAQYSHSWELLHTNMRARFDRGSYVQDRAHVFNGHFGADTFSFDIGETKKMKNWKMEKEGEAFESVYELEVKQEYHGKYGHFIFVQFVYVVEEDGEWRILWDYKK